MIFTRKKDRFNDLFKVRNETFASVDKEFARIKKKTLEFAKCKMPESTNCIVVEAKKGEFKFKEGVLHGKIACFYVNHEKMPEEEARNGWHDERYGEILGSFEKEFSIKVRGCIGIGSNVDTMWLDMNQYGEVDTRFIFFAQHFEV